LLPPSTTSTIRGGAGVGSVAALCSVRATILSASLSTPSATAATTSATASTASLFTVGSGLTVAFGLIRVAVIALVGLITAFRVGAFTRGLAILVHGLRCAGFVRLTILLLTELRRAIASTTASTAPPPTPTTTALTIALLSVLRMALQIWVSIATLLVELLLIIVAVIAVRRGCTLHRQRGRHRAVFVAVIAHQDHAALGFDTTDILSA